MGSRMGPVYAVRSDGSGGSGCRRDVGLPAAVASREGLIYFGRGAVVLPKSERESGRYRFVGVSATDPDRAEVSGYDLRGDVLRQYQGATVEIRLAVEDVYPPTGAGDLRLGLEPTAPEVGQQLNLGRGKLCVSSDERTRPEAIDRTLFGVVPDDLRYPYLDPREVFRGVGQVVTAYLRPDGAGAVDIDPATIPVAVLVPCRTRSNGRKKLEVCGFKVYGPDSRFHGEMTTVDAFRFCKSNGWEQDISGVAPARGGRSHRANRPKKWR